VKDGFDYDVLILGSGIAGTILGAILSNNGVKAALIDAGTHPRFAIGESTIPLTSGLLRLMADRFGIPELRNLTTFKDIEKSVGPTCGVKSNFGFVYHREGERHKPEETSQIVIPKMLDIEHHLFRQDVDAYMLRVAVGYGVDIYQQTRVQDFEVGDDGVTIETDKGTFRGRYLVDGSGHGSPIARKLELREQPTRLKHHSRGLFTHMIGVKPFDDCVEPSRKSGQPHRWHNGTLHHVFDGGWLWVIPFDNHGNSCNNLCSVGFLLDPRRHPRPDGNPEDEFRSIIARYPDMALQFENARAVRPWVSSGRIQ
jgi:FADH2 O2-dependent halogenase